MIVYLESGGAAVDIQQNIDKLPDTIFSYQSLIDEDVSLSMVIEVEKDSNNSFTETVLMKGEDGFDEYIIKYSEEKAKIQWDKLTIVEKLVNDYSQMKEFVFYRIDYNGEEVFYSNVIFYEFEDQIVIHGLYSNGNTNLFVDLNKDGVIEYSFSKTGTALFPTKAISEFIHTIVKEYLAIYESNSPEQYYTSKANKTEYRVVMK